MPKKHRNFQAPVYGMNTFGDLFSPRQLVALNTFADLVEEARSQLMQDCEEAKVPTPSERSTQPPSQRTLPSRSTRRLTIGQRSVSGTMARRI